MYCENHPEKQVNTRCKYCWKPICSDCLIMVGQESFCSLRCYAVFLLNEIRWQCRRIFFRQDLYLRSKIVHINKYSTLALILIFFSMGLIFFYSKTTEERYVYPPEPPPVTANVPSASSFGKVDVKEQNLKEQNLLKEKEKKGPLEDFQNNLSNGDASSSTLAPGGENSTFNISLATDYPKPPPYIVAICGEAPSNSIVALYNNGRLGDTVPCRKGRFIFPRIRLKRNKNLLQAKLITPDGDFRFSNRLELDVDIATSKIQEKGIDIRRGNLQYPGICLSFDAGTNEDASSYILKALKKKGVQTTIFLTGAFIRRNPKIVMQMVNDGHEIGNHTDTHPHLAKFENRRFKCLPWVNREFVHRELKKVEEAFYHLTGKNLSPYWRSPYGESNLEIRKWAEELGYVHVSWTCGRAWEDGLDSLDWVTDTSSIKYHSADEIQDQIINFGKGTRYAANGGVVLMHLSTSRSFKDAVYTRLPEIIDGLRDRGCEIVKISQVLSEIPEKGGGEGQIKSAGTNNP